MITVASDFPAAGLVVNRYLIFRCYNSGSTATAYADSVVNNSLGLEALVWC